YRKILRGINDALDSLINPLKVAENYVDRISKGDIPEKITEEYKGDFNNIKNNLNSCIDEIGVLVGEVGVVIGLAREGDLAKRANPDRSKGVYRKILRGINDALDSLINPLKVAENYVDRISKGDIPEKITEEYKGDFNNIKNNLNSCIDEIKGVTAEMTSLVQAASEGILSKRGDADKLHGAYKNTIQGMNGLIDSIANPLEELMICLQKMAANDLTKKMSKDYLGIWSDMKNAANDLHARLVKIRETVSHISDGNLSDLEEYRRIGRRSENDTLMPAFTKLLESTNQMADVAQSIANGNLSVEVSIRSENDVLAKSLTNMINVLSSLENEMGLLSKAAQEGQLQVRGNAAKFKGAYHGILAGVNDTLDAVLKPIREAADCLKEMAQGNLDVAMKGDYKGGHAVIKDNLNATLAALNDILNQVSVAVDQVTTGARQVSDSSQSLSQAATESASSLEEITASMHELTSQTSQNAENATQANQLAAQARMSAEKGNQEMANMVRAMSDINASAASISKIIKAIDEIAFQTNLLALNAAVEAARAGKHGKGFTVVAEEVRNLAQRSAAAAKETAEMIEGSIKKTEVGAKIAEDTSKALEEIVIGSTKVTDLIGEIASASKEQAQGIGQINQGLSQVDQVTQQVTASAEESASASEELSSQSLQLKQMLTKFKLKKQGFNMTAAGLPEGITPEMLQMLKSMLQSQQMAAAAGSSMRSGLSGAKFPRKTETEIKPSSLIALDDTEFGGF
ncbi:MAG: methyl-accepting chemotaxis protein, partial [Thermacetogeniaceae bacterium]